MECPYCHKEIPQDSAFCYHLGAIVCGVLSLRVDKQDRKKGFEPNGNKNYAWVSIVISGFVSLVNFSQVILK